MSSEPSPQLRYKISGLKPLSRPIFWVPLGLALVAGIGLWQYRDQLKALNPADLNQGNPNGQTQWIGNDSPAETVPEIDPTTGLPLTTQQNQGKLSDFIANPNSKSPFSPNSPLPPANSALNPFSRAPNSKDSSGQPTRPQIFAPLLPGLANPSAVLPSAPLSSGGNNTAPRPSLPPFRINTPNPADNPLRQALKESNPESIASPQEATAPVLPATNSPPLLPPSIAQPKSMYSNSYQPPIYQPYGSPNANNGGNNPPNSPNSDGRGNNPPTPQRPDFGNYNN